MTTTWRLTWGEGKTAVSFTGDDITAADISAVDALTGAGWKALDPRTGPNVCANLLAVVVARLSGIPQVVVSDEVSNATASQLMAALSVEQPD